MAQAARADPLSIVNAIRTQGCSGPPPSAGRAPAQRDEALDRVARELSRRAPLRDAIERVAYPAASSTSFHVKGASGDATIRRMLAERYCAGITDPRYSELGAFQSGDETWIVLASRLPPAPPPLDPAVVAQRVLELVNAARAEARECGNDRYDATEPVTLSSVLTEAALGHARDMAQRGVLDHRGSNGSTSGERYTRAGYAWRASGENVAAGQRDADAVVAAWLSSPGHCATLMGPYYTEMGIAFGLAAPGSNPAIYWAQAFAAPR